MVNTSTGGAIYAPGRPLPTPETAELGQLSAYGLGKRVVEECPVTAPLGFHSIRKPVALTAPLP